MWKAPPRVSSPPPLPAGADPEPASATRQRIERTHLLGHERRLALRQHEHLRAERHARGDGREVRERHQGFQDGHGRVVGSGGAPVDGDAHDHVVEHVDVVVPDLLDGAGETGHGARALAVRHAGELDRELHRRKSCITRRSY